MRRRIFRLFSRTGRDRARELDEEIEAHLALRRGDLEAQGLSPQEARSEALARFGDLEAARQDLYTASVLRDLSLTVRERLDDLRRDLAVSLRRARARPGHTLIRTAIFALGIGLVTVMFSITDHVLFRPLPFPEGERLVSLQSVPEQGVPFQSVSMGNWYDWKTENRTLSQTAIYREMAVGVSAGTEVVRARAALVAGSFFETLAMPMKVGRPFLAEEAQAGESLIVVSEGFWQRTLGGNPSLSEQTVSVDGSDYRVVGVAPMGVTFPSQVDLWIPFQYRPMPGASRNNVNWLGIGRLAGGVTIQQAEADLSSIADGIREADPEALYSFGVGVESLREAVVGDTAGSLIMLQGAVLLVLLVGCANLMGLEFAGARERQQEIAVRLSLGVGRGRLLQQLVTEQLAFALVGGSVGILIGGWGTAYFTGRLGSLIPRGHEITFDARVAAVGFGLSLLAGLMSGLAPSWRASAGDPGRVLAESRVVRGGRGLPGSALVSAEVALTVLLLTGGGLLLRSMGSLVRRDLGFDPENVVTLDVTLQAPEYLADVDRVSGYWTTLLATLEQTSGVAAVGAGNWVPTGGGGSTFVELPEIGRTESGAGYRVVSDRYFEAMGTPLLRGRGFGVEDQDGSERVVIVNETMARTLWPGENPLGKRVRAAGMEDYFFGGQAPWLTVIGVVGDLRHHGFESDTRSEMFTLYRQVPWMARIITVIVRARPGLLASVMTTAQETARAVDPGLPVQVGRMDRRVRDLMVERRLTTSVLVGFGLVALGLASLGLYGLLSLAVSARTREMAIRSALGAHRADLVGMVVLSGLRVVALGLLIGALAAMGLLRVLDSLLVGVKFSDPITGAVVLATITLVSLAAVMAPAFRAARMDPAEALRNQ